MSLEERAAAVGIGRVLADNSSHQVRHKYPTDTAIGQSSGVWIARRKKQCDRGLRSAPVGSRRRSARRYVMRIARAGNCWPDLQKLPPQADMTAVAAAGYGRVTAIHPVTRVRSAPMSTNDTELKSIRLLL